MKRFFALSRTTHGILDLAGPAFCAVLWLGGFPSWQVTVVAVATAFAAYTAVYALNDLVGIAGDRAKFAQGEIKEGYSVEASRMRYPLAQGLLSMRSALFWFAFWFVLAILGCYLLNPIVVIVLLGAALLEVVYCLLFRVTYWRTLVSGLVKASGPIAAVLVVDSTPGLGFLLLVAAWVFFWEVGGQNVPADWNDTEEDLRVGAKTIPIRFGFRNASLVVVGTLILTVIHSMFLVVISPLPLGFPYMILTVLAGFYFLLLPAYRLYKTRDGRLAARLFDRASYYPLAQLVLISAFAVFL